MTQESEENKRGKGKKLSKSSLSILFKVRGIMPHSFSPSHCHKRVSQETIRKMLIMKWKDHERCRQLLERFCLISSIFTDFQLSLRRIEIKDSYIHVKK